MNKKIFATILAVCVMVSLSSAALADDDNLLDTKETTKSAEIIPVFGYVGPDAIITEPDPELPGTPSAEIYVEVPVKIVFIAFESSNGIVASPKYTIKNLSTLNDLKVEIENFSQSNEAAEPLNGQLTLKLTSHEGADLVPDLFPSNYSTKKLLTDNLPKMVDDSDANHLGFVVNGNWSGSFDSTILPEFDLTVKFSVV